MRRTGYLFVVAVLFAIAAHAQPTSSWGRTLVVIPFDNSSPVPRMEWLGEGLAAALRSQLNSPVLYVATREERLRAYDRLGIPIGIHPSRATVFRLAEQMDVDYALIGSYGLDGDHLTTTAQLIDMRAPKLLAKLTESAPLGEFGNLQSALAWDLLHLIGPDFSVPKEKYVAGGPPLRLDALESYTRGILASTADERVRRFRESTSLNPAFAEAWLELGKAYYDQKADEAAMASFARIPPSSPIAREANFYLGLSAYGHGDFETADKAFEFVAARLPLAEVYNNLGVVAARRGQKKALADFERAVRSDPSDPDYRFNLAVALSEAGDKARANRELHIALEERPDDVEARALSDSRPSPAGSVVNSASTAKFLPERLKRSYQEDAFREMTVQMQSWAEQQFARSDPRTHARYHIELGKELLAHGFIAEAEGELRHAATVDPANPAPLAALARVYDERGDARQARAQAEASLRVHESVEAYLFLTQLDLREDRTEAAQQNINRVLQIEPANAAALELKRTLAARFGQRGQP